MVGQLSRPTAIPKHVVGDCVVWESLPYSCQLLGAQKWPLRLVCLNTKPLGQLSAQQRLLCLRHRQLSRPQARNGQRKEVESVPLGFLAAVFNAQIIPKMGVDLSCFRSISRTDAARYPLSRSQLLQGTFYKRLVQTVVGRECSVGKKRPAIDADVHGSPCDHRSEPAPLLGGGDMLECFNKPL